MQDVDRFLIFPTSPIKIDFIQRVGKANIFAKRRQTRIPRDF